MTEQTADEIVASGQKEQARKAIKGGGRDSIYAPLDSHYPPARPKPKLPEGLIDHHPDGDHCYDPTAFPGRGGRL